MNRKVKAFTLIELIVVIVIFGIIMSGLMNFYKPLRETYVDSTMYEDMRTAQDGILEYLSESTKYAENMAIYDEGVSVPGSDLASHPSGMTVSTPAAAYEAFIDAYGITKDSDKRRVQIIVINRSTEFDDTGTVVSAGDTSNKKYTGRIITNILRTGDHDTPTASQFTNSAGVRTAAGVDTGDTYMALGGGYYGDSNYAIFIDYAKTFGSSGDAYAGGITFSVQNSLENKSGVVKSGSEYGGSKVVVDGSAVTMTTSQSNRTLNMKKGFKYYTLTSKTPAGSIGTDGKISGGNKDTYIVFITPDEAR